ncbi:hypothetical protein USDA257_c23810 [Sinorhizobium fredii USDA 257]|uniref:Uncharacterized protein n=1 Tax=Sinorhizobium fredii (strain USDA 257) TaxID=1185652 RepID=I3X502_SINF2|nr:hypothetical protein USDA257_c23810 [Sinorhizobium fredii USDA 257]
MLTHHRLNLLPIRRLNQCFRTVSSLTFSTLSVGSGQPGRREARKM